VSELTVRQQYKIAIIAGLACSLPDHKVACETAGKLADALIEEDEKHEAELKRRANG
jgi:hypothetical protein